jgi:hypothetical protein
MHLDESIIVATRAQEVHLWNIEALAGYNAASGRCAWSGRDKVLMPDIPHFVAWIDYLIASDDPADQALATEYRIQSWAMRELVEATAAEMMAGQIVADWIEKMEAQRAVCDELTKRVYERAQVLVAAGALPADEATVTRDWRARATGVHLTEWPEDASSDPSSTFN